MLRYKYVIPLIIGLLLMGRLFEASPAVQDARQYVSQENYNSPDVSCADIDAARPWYGKLNQWFWLWLVISPLLVFAFRPTSPPWQRLLGTLSSIGIGHISLNLSVHAGCGI